MEVKEREVKVHLYQLPGLLRVYTQCAWNLQCDGTITAKQSQPMLNKCGDIRINWILSNSNYNVICLGQQELFVIWCNVTIPLSSIFLALITVAELYCKKQDPLIPATAVECQHQHALFQAGAGKQHGLKCRAKNGQHHQSQKQGIRNVDWYYLANLRGFQDGCVWGSNIYHEQNMNMNSCINCV